jgi:hypothetical protein
MEARYRELKEDVESPRALRKEAGKAQANVAAALKIRANARRRGQSSSAGSPHSELTEDVALVQRLQCG